MPRLAASVSKFAIRLLARARRQFGGVVKSTLLSSAVLAGTLLLGGCAAGRLYPVQGPLSTLSPPPVLTAKMSGAFQSGEMEVSLASGEKGAGHWQLGKPESPLAKKSNGSAPAPESLASVWDAVYGRNFYATHVPGKLMAHAEITGDRGTRLQMEMYRPVGEGADLPVNFRGVARDNKGNIYKVTF